MRHAKPLLKAIKPAVPYAVQERAAVWLAALFAALFGAFIVYGVGLANADALHNAAHDTRHAFTFPCH